MSPKAIFTMDQRKMLVWLVTDVLIFILAVSGLVGGEAALNAFLISSGAFMAGNGLEHIGAGIGGMKK